MKRQSLQLNLNLDRRDQIVATLLFIQLNFQRHKYKGKLSRDRNKHGYKLKHMHLYVKTYYVYICAFPCVNTCVHMSKYSHICLCPCIGLCISFMHEYIHIHRYTHAAHSFNQTVQTYIGLP